MRFEEAVENYTSYLLKLSYLYVKDRQVAEDIVQDVMAKLYQTHGHELTMHNPKAYIVQMTVNKCRDYFRSWHYKRVQLTDIFESKSEKVEENYSELLLEAILALPLKYREVVILYYYNEENTAMIAQTLHIPIGTVKTRLQKARQLLKGLLEEEEEEEEVKSFAK